jgi:hypothetical protein
VHVFKGKYVHSFLSQKMSLGAICPSWKNLLFKFLAIMSYCSQTVYPMNKKSNNVHCQYNRSTKRISRADQSNYLDTRALSFHTDHLDATRIQSDCMFSIGELSLNHYNFFFKDVSVHLLNSDIKYIIISI